MYDVCITVFSEDSEVSVTSSKTKTFHAENIYFHEQISGDSLHGRMGLSPDEVIVGGLEAALSWRGGDLVVVVIRLQNCPLDNGGVPPIDDVCSVD